MRRKLTKIAATSMAIVLAVSGTTALARSSKRAAWRNDASSDKTVASLAKDACYVEDGSETDEHQVYSNVYANSTEWEEYKTKWESIRNNYEQVSLTPGTDATEVNLAWLQ